MTLEGLVVLTASFLAYLMIYMILALSMNLEYGFTGNPNLGKVLFFFMGAMVTAVVTTQIYDAILGTTDPLSALAARERTRLASENPMLATGVLLLSLALSALLAGGAGFLASLPAVPLKGDMLAITLLIFGESMRVFMRTYEPIVGGVFGISGIAGPFVAIRDKTLSSLAFLATLSCITLLLFVLAERLANSPLGRVMKAVRDDEVAAYVLGKDVARVRGWVLFIGSAMAGIAGSMYVYYTQSVFADDFIPLVTFSILAMTMLGGIANNHGALMGAAVVSAIDRFSQASFLALLGISVGFDITYIRYTAIGVIMLLILFFKPRGIIEEGPVRTVLYEVLSGRRGNRRVQR